MLILDTNHYSEFTREGHLGSNLRARMQHSGDDVFLTIITAEEVLKGWLAEIQPHRQSDRGVGSYRQFQESLEDLINWDVLPWSVDAADNFERLRAAKIRIGTMDLRIAAIALEYGALVLTRNLRDFAQVPGLKVENWLD